MAEIVAYRVERTLNELNLLVEFKLLSKEQAKEIVKKRQNFEYVLRRRTRTKLDYLRYIKFELTLLESIDKYKKSVIEDHYKSKKTNDKLEELDRRILLLQAKKLNDVITARCGHISSLYRKLCTTFTFDKNLWLAYIEFAKSRNWPTRVSALYWRLLRVAGNDPSIWVAAARHEYEVVKSFETARALFLRALRHHKNSHLVWAEYYKMEVAHQEMVDRRARVVCKTLARDDDDDDRHTSADRKRRKTEPSDGDGAALWDEDVEAAERDAIEEQEKLDEAPEELVEEAEGAEENQVKPIHELPDPIISGQLPKVVLKNATEALKSSRELSKFLEAIKQVGVAAE